MRKSTKLVLAAGAATLAVAGAGSAFTAGNTVPDSQAGYGQGTVSGVTVTDIHYTQNAADASKLDTVVFDTATDIMTHAKVSTLTLEWVDNSPSTQFPCVNAGTGPYTITCDVSGGAVPFANVGKTDLTVADS